MGPVVQGVVIFARCCRRTIGCFFGVHIMGRHGLVLVIWDICPEEVPSEMNTLSDHPGT